MCVCLSVQISPFYKIEPSVRASRASLFQAELPIYILPLSVHQDIFSANSILFKSYLIGLFFLPCRIALHLLNVTFCSLALIHEGYPETDLLLCHLPPLCFLSSKLLEVLFWVFRFECWSNMRILVSREHLNDPFFKDVYLESPCFL